MDKRASTGNEPESTPELGSPSELQRQSQEGHGPGITLQADATLLRVLHGDMVLVDGKQGHPAQLLVLDEAGQLKSVQGAGLQTHDAASQAQAQGLHT